MAYDHGVKILETETPLLVPVQADSALPVAVGIAPVHKLEDPSVAVNRPSLVFSYGEGVADMGFSYDWKHFNLSEMLYSQFRLFAISPLVMINVWDPMQGAQDFAEPDLSIINGVATIEDPMAMISTVKVVNPNSGFYVRGEDYSLHYDDDENLLITVIEGGAIPDTATSLSVTYKVADPSVVTDNTIAGGVSPTNARTGIELITEVFLKFRKIPCFCLSPGWSHIPKIAALLKAKVKKLGYNFTGIALCDLPTTGPCANYRNLPEWKNLNGYVDPYMFVDWPCVAVGDLVFHASTILAGMYGMVDAKNDGIPFEQASNKTLSMTGMCDEDGNTIPMLDDAQANYLNENGIGTFINFDGWRAWGVETSAFPGNTDIKDYERSVRRMFCYVENVVNRTFRQEVDKPIRRLLIDKALLTGNEYLNSLKARQAIIGGYVEFLRADNNNQGIMSGKLYFRVHLTPPNAAKAITFDFMYDPELLKALF